MSTNKGKLVLIPTTLASETSDAIINEEIRNAIKGIDHYFVENVRSARRYISSLNTGRIIEELHFYLFNKNTEQKDLIDLIALIDNGHDVGIISESGCPGIADPGAVAVAMAQEKSISVKPLVGPSSILMSLMASGFNGQQFTFHGYLPIDKQARKTAIKKLEKELINTGYTQIFIETPYRNDKFFKDLINALSSATKVCLAVNITANDEYIKTLTVKEWKKEKLEIGKRPAIFLIGQ